jgi:hypothetical protein
MTELESAVGEHLAHEQSAVAAVRIGLAAHQRHPVLASAVDQALYGRTKRGLLCHPVVKRSSLLVVVLVAGWSPAELFSEEDSGCPCRRERSRSARD